MKAKTFENLIRKVVREEIDYALRREIKTLKEDLRESQNYELKPKSIIPPQKSLKEDIMGSKPIKRKSFKKQSFVKDNMLNNLLNETAAGDTNTQTGNAPVSLAQPFATGAPLPMDTTGLPSSVADAVTRDYSSLMKAINKKKGL